MLRERNITAIKAALSAGAATAACGQYAVFLYAETIVWGVDQKASAELASDGTAIRSQCGPWVALSADQQRAARGCAKAANAAYVAAKLLQRGAAQAAQALVGQVVEFADMTAYGCPPPAVSSWLITHIDGGLAVAEPVGLTDDQRMSSKLLARRIKPDGAGGYKVIDSEYCKMFTATIKGSL